MKNIQKISAVIFSVMIVASFILSAPNPSVINNLMKNQIQKIKAENANLLRNIDYSTDNVAFAQEGDGEPGEPILICCSNGEQPQQGTTEVCDTSACTPMCCPTGSNPNPGYICDSTLTSCNSGGQGGGDDDEDQCITNGTCPQSCLNAYAQNFKQPGSCVFLPICCDATMLNFDAAKCDSSVTANQAYKHDQNTCVAGNPICCNGNYDNYKAPSNRNDDAGNNPMDYCDNDECACNSDLPSNQQVLNPQGSSGACGGSGDYCTIESEFSVIKSGVAIRGDVTMLVVATCESQIEAELKDYAAGLAVIDATPSTPLNTPITLDALTTYTVTSKDYCLNIIGDQGIDEQYNRSSEGMCCSSPNVPDDASETCVPGPSCGFSNEQTFESEPTVGLCDNGTSSNVESNTSTYTWSCAVEAGNATTQCSAYRTCNGASCEVCTELDCGDNDLCKNVVGGQDSSYLSTNNVSPDSSGTCWNATTGACGSISQTPYVTETPSSNLCVSGSYPSLVSYDGDAKIYSWDCINEINNSNITPACSVRECIGTECQTEQSTDLIKNFKAQPSIVSKTGEGCLLTWESEIDSSISDPEQQCQINGNTVSDNNTTGTRVGPGSYSLMCRLGVTFQLKSLKCSIGPDYNEI